MLKYIPGLILCLVVLTELAYVSPTYAASANVVITQIQAGGVASALEEEVTLYNNSSEEVNITNWCLKNKSNVSFACFTPADGFATYLPGHSYATVASYNYANFMKFYLFSVLYDVTNQSSGNIVAGNDTVSLVDETGLAIDSHSWTSTILGGKSFTREPPLLRPLSIWILITQATGILRQYCWYQIVRYKRERPILMSVRISMDAKILFRMDLK